MILPLLAATAASPTVPAHDAASRAAITAYIRACEVIWAKSNTGPQPEVQVFLADDYRGVSSRGKVMRKAGMAAGGDARASALY